MADDLSGWTLQPAQPGVSPQELGGWTLHPVGTPAAPTDEHSSTLSALAQGAGQGVTLGFQDEVNGAIQALGDKLMGNSPESSLGELYRRNRDSFRREADATKAEHPLAYGGAELAGGLASSFLPGLGISKGAKAAQVLLKSALAGGVGALGQDQADLTRGEYGRAALDTGVGTALGAGAGGIGIGLGGLGQKAFQRVAGIDEAVARKAAEAAAAETASARSAAGRAAQDAYKQLEHLRELGKLRALSPEEAQVAASLEGELGDKAQQKLLSSVAAKDATSAAYVDALQSEAQRAKDIAAQKLSGGDAMSQLKARALRYGLPAVGGALAGMTGFGGHGGLVGAGSGALMGAGLRPMMHSMLRMASQPSVARPAAQLAGNALSSLAAPLATHSAAPASLELSPEIAAMVAALRQKPEQDTSNWTLEGSPQ